MVKSGGNSHLPEFSNFKVSFISWFSQIVNVFVVHIPMGLQKDVIITLKY